ncbi:MAG: SRPBCC family protein [Thermoplasmatota archaeon]
MEPTFVTIRVSRFFPYPMEPTFTWLTDYQDDDHRRAGAVIKRRDVVKRENDTVRLDAELHVAGVGGNGIAEVKLFPPDHYVATIVEGRGRGSVYDYKLTPQGNGTRLDVTYRIRVKRLSSRVKVWLAKPVAKRDLQKMWDGFTVAMKKELG